MIILTLVFCLILLAGANLVARWIGPIGASLFAFLFIFVPACMMFSSSAVLINAALLILAGVGCGREKSKNQIFRRMSYASTGIALLSACGIAAYETVHFDGETKYPMESMGARLEYENVRSAAASDSTFAALPVSAQERITELEREMNGSYGNLRARALEQMHRSTVQRFINSPGFGVGRMTHLSDSWIKRVEAPEPIKLNPPNDSECATPVPESERQKPGPAPPDWSAEHIDNYKNFVNADGFGLVRDREQVAGFLSHGFSKKRHPFRFRVSRNDEQPQFPRWEPSQLDLVSLLRFETPRAYVSDHLPRMEELRDAETRSLNSFEEDSLERLRKGEDFVVESESHFARAIGSLRAAKQCLECHKVERGHLLGAFSYEFRLVVGPNHHQE